MYFCLRHVCKFNPCGLENVNSTSKIRNKRFFNRNAYLGQYALKTDIFKDKYIVCLVMGKRNPNSINIP